ncbi:hypothetical protein [Glycomyces harbinensis]|uniref:Uncharacterized protein n=1 Tax=Glycomyces harbinensis TaxID=58114 RepID=A0A1G6W2T2_9ACTN|nr:hypothetical protein [Glycomyces harbinensis]SDD59355.1 hypothetical protein SAMN05216270_105238 [Glycomyces harbinensis]
MNESRLDPVTTAFRGEIAQLLTPGAAEWLWFPAAFLIAYLLVRFLGVGFGFPLLLKGIGLLVQGAVIAASWLLLMLDWGAARVYRSITPVLVNHVYVYGDGIAAAGTAVCERTGSFTAWAGESMRGEPRRWAWALFGVLFLAWNLLAHGMGTDGEPTWPSLAWLQWIFAQMKAAA